jgi:hypothetical protein
MTIKIKDIQLSERLIEATIKCLQHNTGLTHTGLYAVWLMNVEREVWSHYFIGPIDDPMTAINDYLAGFDQIPGVSALAFQKLN